MTTIVKTIQTRSFGRDGIQIPILGLGGQSLIQNSPSDEQPIEMIRYAIDNGIRYVDTAPVYGASETRIGKAIQGCRNDVFLATKTLYRKASGAWKSLERSLERLQTDYIDLLQLHCFMHSSEIKAVFSKHGVIGMAEEARRQGLIKHIGITGHYDPHLLANLLKLYPFDSVLMPVNPADTASLSFLQITLPVALETGASVIAMKVMGAGILTARGMDPGGLLRYALSTPASVAIVSGRSIADIDYNIKTALAFREMPEDERRKLELRSDSLYRQCNEIYKRHEGKHGLKIAIRNWFAAQGCKYAPGWWHL